MNEPFPSSVRFAVGASTLVLLSLAERTRPLRPATQPKARHVMRNLIVAAVGFGALAVTYGRTVVPMATFARAEGFGLTRWTGMPTWLRVPISVVLLDYSLWLWHLLNHKVPFLWRFHLAHHIDADVDVSTALRFHVGELLLSLPFRMLQVFAIGVDLGPLLLWETALLIGTEFHHANIRLPPRVERALQWVVVTPRMHGLHHSVAARETNTNFGTLLTAWDRIHATFAVEISTDGVVVGVAGFAESQTISDAMVVPLRRKLGCPVRAQRVSR